MRSGRRLAIDVGKARIGVAVCDFHGILASGVATVARQSDLGATASLIAKVIEQHEIALSEILEIYVGLPTSLKGKTTESTVDAILVARAVAESFEVPVRLVDERLSTVSAAATLRNSGFNSKSGRSVIDQVAATVILEQALAIERASNVLPGRALSELEAS